MCDEGREGTLGGHGVEIQSSDTVLDSTDKTSFFFNNPIFLNYFFGKVFSLHRNTVVTDLLSRWTCRCIYIHVGTNSVSRIVKLHFTCFTLFLFYQGYSQSKRAMTAFNSRLTAVKDLKGFLHVLYLQ